MASVVPVNVQVPADATAPMIADFVEHALRVAYVHLRDVHHLRDADWAAPGVYVLLTDDGSGRVYVGKAVGLRARLLQHRTKPKLPWLRAVILKRDTSHGFNSAEIGYLEGRLSAELEAAQSLTVIKGKSDQDVTLPPHMLLSLDAILPSMLAAVRLGGLDVLRTSDLDDGQQATTSATVKTSTFIPGTIADLLASGLLQAGAELHLSQGGKVGKGKVTTSGEIIVNGVAYPSPSKASAVALGLKASNGWEAWHVGSLSGPKLSSLRAQLPPPDEVG